MILSGEWVTANLFYFYIWCSLHRHTAITRAASLLLGILSAVFWQRWWWSSRPPCGNNFCSRVSLCATCGLRNGAAKIRPESQDNRLTLNKKFVKPAWMNFFLYIFLDDGNSRNKNNQQKQHLNCNAKRQACEGSPTSHSVGFTKRVTGLAPHVYLWRVTPLKHFQNSSQLFSLHPQVLLSSFVGINYFNLINYRSIRTKADLFILLSHTEAWGGEFFYNKASLWLFSA